MAFPTTLQKSCKILCYFLDSFTITFSYVWHNVAADFNEISKVLLQLIFDTNDTLFLLFNQKVMTDCHQFTYFAGEIVPAKHKSNNDDLAQFDLIEEITC